MEELKAHFRPEFLNRLDEMIMFKPLTKDNIYDIIDLLVADVNQMCIRDSSCTDQRRNGPSREHGRTQGSTLRHQGNGERLSGNAAVSYTHLKSGRRREHEDV